MIKSKDYGGEPGGIVSRGGLAGLVLLSLLTVQAVAQEGAAPSGRSGINTDSRGGVAVDPSKNVLDTVSALKEMLKELRTTDRELSDAKLLGDSERQKISTARQDDLRNKDFSFQVMAREAADRRIADLALAETRRTNDLAQQKQLFDLELARILKASVDEKSLLLATQLREVKTDLSERMSKQEQFRWESGGKSSISDPSVAALTAEVRSLKERGASTSGVNEGRGDAWAIIGGVIMMLIGAGALVVNIMKPKGAHP